MTAFAYLLAALDWLLLAVYVAQRVLSTPRPPWRLYEVLLGWQSLFFLGCCGLLVAAPDAPTLEFIVIGLVGQLSLTTGVLIASALPVAVAPLAPELSAWERRIAYSTMVAAGIVCAAFTFAVLRNEELGLILAGVVTGDEKFLDYRLMMTQGEAIYLAPGYVKQFRDVLLPASLLTLMAFTATPIWWLVLPMWAVGAVAAVLSGERSVIMISLFVLGAGLVLRPGISAAARRTVIALAGALVFAAFIGSTVLLGRATEDASTVAILVESAEGLFDRAALTVPRENSLGFPMWGALAPTNGRSWLGALSGILPQSQRGLDNELHELLGGGAAGNAPLGLSPDAYLAFGMLGVMLAPLLFVMMLAYADRLLLERPVAIARALRIMLVPLSFGWYSPFLFILNGGVVLLFGAFALGLMVPTREARR